MAKDKKKKLSAKALTAILTPLLAILLAFSIALSVITTSMYDLVLRDIFGETDFSSSSAVDGVDAAYYTRDITDSEALAGRRAGIHPQSRCGRLCTALQQHRERQGPARGRPVPS